MEATLFSVGETVQIIALNTQKYNEELAQICGPLLDNKRWPVQLYIGDKDKLAIKSMNLKRVMPIVYKPSHSSGIYGVYPILVDEDEKTSYALKPIGAEKDELDASNLQLPKQGDNYKPPNNLTHETKRAMAWAHFLAHLWDRYVNVTHKCEFLAPDDNMGDILQNVCIFGGGCRDYLLGKEFDDIDMFLNTRELNKIHLQHLRKYHANKVETQSESVQCAYWRLYARKFKHGDTTNYQLNASFFMNILMNSKELKGKLSITNYKVSGNIVYMMKLLEDVFYKKYNLKGQDLDLADAFKLEMHESMKDLSTDHELLQYDDIRAIGKLYHQKSMLSFNESNSHRSLIDVDMDLFTDDDDDDDDMKLNFKKNKLMVSRQVLDLDVDGSADINLKEINLPIHETKARERFTSNDFSINTMVVILGEFYDLDPKNINYNFHVWGTVDTSHLNDGLKDLQNKILRTPMFDPLDTIKAQYSPKRGSVHFWRLVKFRARYDDQWVVDSKLKQETIQFSKVWLNEERFTNKEWYQVFVLNMIEKYVKRPEEHKMRFEAMDEFSLHKFVVPYFKKHQGFKQCLLDKMNSFSNDHTQSIKKELKHYGYIE